MNQTQYKKLIHITTIGLTGTAISLILLGILGFCASLNIPKDLFESSILRGFSCGAAAGGVIYLFVAVAFLKSVVSKNNWERCIMADTEKEITLLHEGDFGSKNWKGIIFRIIGQYSNGTADAIARAIIKEISDPPTASEWGRNPQCHWITKGDGYKLTAIFPIVNMVEIELSGSTERFLESVEDK